MANFLVSPASVLVERIYDIALTVGEAGAWVSKNRILNWWWMMATFMAYKIWHFEVYIKLSLSLL
jgi:hypothetical protein